ncbi:MAG: 30S ribosomal protein S16 [Termitinemataceae bacterium]|jgi:small subunit ribosomal protein S16|nr:MAG: 30S ribosomal protein S16 [Termitinemataceae bacterium]
MSASIRLKKFGTKKRPYYRIVVMDHREPRDGRTIDELGYYHPISAEEEQLSFDMEKAKKWLDYGAKPSDTVLRLLNKKGVYRAV